MRTRASSFANQLCSHWGAWVLVLCGSGATAGCWCPSDPLCLEEGTYRAYLEAREASSTCIESWTEGWEVEFEVREWGPEGDECGQECCRLARARLTHAPEGQIRERTSDRTVSGWASEATGTCYLAYGLDEVIDLHRDGCGGTLRFAVRGSVDPNPGPGVLSATSWTSSIARADCGEPLECEEHFVARIEKIGD